MDKLRELGGVAGICSALGTDHHHGLQQDGKGSESIEEHRRVYGSNTLPTAPQKNFFLLCFENVQDPIILLLIAAATVSNLVRSPYAMLVHMRMEDTSQCRGMTHGQHNSSCRTCANRR